MLITNDTTTYQIAELMGPEADELDGRIMMALILSAGFPDTSEISNKKWSAMLDEAQRIRANEYE